MIPIKYQFAIAIGTVVAMFITMWLLTKYVPPPQEDSK